MLPFTPLDLLGLSPVILLALGGMVLLLGEATLTSGNRRYQGWLSALFAGLSLVDSLWLAMQPVRPLFGGAAQGDPFAYFIAALVCVALLLSSLTASGYLAALGAERGEFYALSQFAAAGMVLLAMSTDTVMIFIALEVMSLPIYALAAWLRRGHRPSEAAIKYFVLGGFSSALFLFGAAMGFGASGSTRLSALAQASGSSTTAGLLVVSAALMVTAFAFKVAAVPFHMWAPDVYEGSPTPATAFMAAAVKVAAFAALVRILLVGFTGTRALPGPMLWGPVLWWLALLTMVVGNLFALVQRSVKRMLAYSSVAHAGYVLVALAASARAAVRPEAIEAVLVYLSAYTLMGFGAFAALSALEKEVEPNDDYQAFAGLAKRRPWLALAMGSCLLSLAGIPPTVGFLGKLYVFRVAVDSGNVGLSVMGVLASIIGAYYYLRVVVFMYMRESTRESAEPVRSLPAALSLSATALGILVLGMAPSLLSGWAQLFVTPFGK